jgi:hypothetical protein
MQATSALPTIAVLVGAVVTLVLVGFCLGRWLNRKVVIGVSLAYLITYIVLFSIAFAMGDARMHVPWILAAALYVLNVPLMYLLYVPPKVFGNHWWGDDFNFILVLAILNALVWGTSAAWIFRRTRRSYAA